MSYGVKRGPFQTLPGGDRVNCVEIKDDNFADHEWFMRSIEYWPLPKHLEVYWEKGSCDKWVRKDWDFVLVVPWISVRSYWSSNDGMQAWRHRKTGYVVPDHCRQTGGCPEVWTSGDIHGKRELRISNLEEIEELVVVRRDQVTAKMFPEHDVGTRSRSS